MRVGHTGTQWGEERDKAEPPVKRLTSGLSEWSGVFVELCINGRGDVGLEHNLNPSRQCCVCHTISCSLPESVYLYLRHFPCFFPFAVVVTTRSVVLDSSQLTSSIH